MPLELVEDTYKKAPISELICGVIFHTNVLVNIIHELIEELKPKFRTYQISPTIFEEELVGYRLAPNMNYNAAGFTLYRLIENRLHIQIQNNLVLVNWVRSDQEEVGEYPGFTHVFTIFKNIFNLVEEKLKKINPYVNISANIKSFTLHYQDRIVWQDYIKSLVDVGSLLNIKIPNIPSSNGNVNASNNIASKYTIPLEDVGGYAIITVATSTGFTNKQLLIVECRVKGKLEPLDLDIWFHKAHALQVNFFNSIFKSDILKTWRQ